MNFFVFLRKFEITTFRKIMFVIKNPFRKRGSLNYFKKCLKQEKIVRPAKRLKISSIFLIRSSVQLMHSFPKAPADE